MRLSNGMIYVKTSQKVAQLGLAAHPYYTNWCIQPNPEQVIESMKYHILHKEMQDIAGQPNKNK